MPQCLFQILGEPAEKGDCYEFKSVEVKQTAFRIDGVFVPKPGSGEDTVIFVEVQFQKDEQFYGRLFCEIMMYLAQNPDVENWRAIAVYPRQSIAPEFSRKYRALTQSDQFQEIYLEDFLGMSSEEIGIQLMQLIVSPKKKTSEYLNELVVSLEDRTTPNRQGIIDLAVTIMVYKFENLTREEIESMFTTNDLKQTRFYQDVFEEGREEGIEQGREEGLRRAVAESLQRERALLVKQLTRKLGELSPEVIESVEGLVFEELDILAEKLFDFEQVGDLEIWLQELSENRANEQ